MVAPSKEIDPTAFRTCIEKKEDGSVFYHCKGWFTRYELEDLIDTGENIRRDDSFISGKLAVR